MPKAKAKPAEAAATFGGRNDETTDEERRRLAKKVAKHMARLGLDENGVELDNFSLTQYPVREWKFTIPGMSEEVAINPVATMIGVVCLWSIVIWCSADSSTALRLLSEWRSFLSITLTWFLQGSKAVYFFFVMFIWYKYGHVHLGSKGDKPEFSNLTYSSMIFTAGAGNGLLVYSVFEPLSHRMYHFFAQAGYRSEDEKDLFAICISVASWGLGGWAPYSIVAIAMSLAVYRYNLPMCYRSCFFPILGHYTWGWIGDFIDGFIIVVTLTGIFTSLGLLPMNFIAAGVYLGWIHGDSSEETLSAIKNTITCVVTVLSLASVTSGLQGGVKYLCILAMASASLLMFLVLMLDDTKFVLNLQVQTVGYYLQTGIFQLNFWTDAFGQLREGSGRATDGNAAEQWWMESWLNYIMGWWIAAAAVNGQFICSISKGRKVWEVIAFGTIAPVGYCLVWICVWGGVGLRQLRQALELKSLGETYYNNSGHFLSDGSELCYDVPQDTISIGDEAVFTNYLPGVTPVCDFDEANLNSAVFNVLNSFSLGNTSMGPELSVLFMFACVVFYMTGAGSAAHFVDRLASSGRKNGHLARRMFWVITVGALSATLVTSGGSDALSVVQAAMILCGVPCALFLWYMMQTVVLMCEAADKGKRRPTAYKFPDQTEFSMPIYGGVFNVIEYVVSLGRVNPIRVDLGMHQPTHFQVVECFKGIFVPFVSLYEVLRATYPQNSRTNMATCVCFGACYIGWFGFFIASFSYAGANGCMRVLFIVKGLILALVRSGFRAQYNIRSNAVGDLVASMFFWPQVLSQMRAQEVSQSIVTTQDGEQVA